MNNGFLLIAIGSISFCLLQNNSCRGKTAGSNSAVPSATATPSPPNSMTKDPGTSSSAPTPTASNSRQLSGLWGGNHVTLEISDQGATLEFDCATGSISEPILLDSAGSFDVTGSYTRQGPGPVRQAKQRDDGAHYSGTVTDQTMTLTVRLEGSSAPAINLSLTRDKQGKLWKCY
jgi:hypothetical protein